MNGRASEQETFCLVLSAFCANVFSSVMKFSFYVCRYE